MNIDELQEGLSPEEVEELQNYQYNEVNVDRAIEEVKTLQTEIERFEELFVQRVEQLQFEKDIKVKRLQRKIDWHLWNLHQIVKNAPDKKETKTQYKKQYLSGDVIIKKEKEKLVKPKLDESIIKEKFSDYKREKIELDWATLKTKLILKSTDSGYMIINQETGEDLSQYISVEIEPERVEIK